MIPKARGIAEWDRFYVKPDRAVLRDISLKSRYQLDKPIKYVYTYMCTHKGAVP
jgi:hypothetical protein